MRLMYLKPRLKGLSQGIFVVWTSDLSKYNLIKLRYNKKTKVKDNYKNINYKNSKGCTFAKTIIYPTSDLKQYMKLNKKIETASTKNAIYVALSRVIDSIAIVHDGPIYSNHKIKIWIDECL